MTRRPSNEVITQSLAAVIALASLFASGLGTLPAHAKDEPPPRRIQAEQPPPPCHANPRAVRDVETVANRDDIRTLPAPLKERLVNLAVRPHSVLPVQAFNEADQPSQLFQYYLLDTTGFEPNVFTTSIAGVNDAVQLSVTGAEALCADMGHLGRRAITFGWLGLVLPACTLSYFGQGALVLANALPYMPAGVHLAVVLRPVAMAVYRFAVGGGAHGSTDEVEERKEIDPHEVDKVPVEGAELELPLLGPQQRAEDDQTREHVERVTAVGGRSADVVDRGGRRRDELGDAAGGHLVVVAAGPLLATLLAAQHQPLVAEGGRSALTDHGEISTYRELRELREQRGGRGQARG